MEGSSVPTAPPHPACLPVTAVSCLAHSGGRGHARLGRSRLLGMWAELDARATRQALWVPVTHLSAMLAAVGEQCSELSAGCWGLGGPGRQLGSLLWAGLGCVSMWVSSEGPAWRPDVLGARGSDPSH